MCKVGDIVVIKNYKHKDKQMKKHSFVVLSDEHGQIGGLDYDIICNVMSSYKNEEQKERKLKYPGNFPITHDDKITDPNNGKDGYIKAEQFYYFNKKDIDYVVIGQMLPEIFNLLIEFIQDLDIEIEDIIENLKPSV